MNHRQLVRDFATDLQRTPGAILGRWRIRARRELAIGYIGWVGHDNLGDEAMFQAVRKAMHPFPVMDLLPEPGERLLTQLGLGGTAMFRAILVGGGTLINPLYLPVVQMMATWKLPLYTVGTGVGNPGFGISLPESFLQGWSSILCNSPLVSVRGPLSQSLLHQAGVTRAEVIGDPALAFAPETKPPFRSRQRLVVNLAQESGSSYGTGNYEIFSDVGQLARQFTQTGGEVIGIALGNGDRKILEAFRHANSLEAMRLEDHRRSGDELLKTLEGSYALISVRLHAAVLASCVGVPSLLLAYRSKCQDFMNSMGLESFAIPLSRNPGATQLQQCFSQILREGELLGEQIYQKALFWKRKQQEYYSRLSAQIENTMTNQVI